MKKRSEEEPSPRFSKRTMRRLRRARWRAGRTYDICGFEKMWATCEMTPNQHARDFLQEFGGLTFRFEHAGKTWLGDWLGDWLSLSGLYVEFLHEELDENDASFRTYEFRTGPLCEIGTIRGCNGGLGMAMNPTGGVFGYAPLVGDDWKAAGCPEWPMWYFGPSGDDALENLAHGRWAIYTNRIPEGELPRQFYDKHNVL